MSTLDSKAFQCLQIETSPRAITIKLNRIDAKNALNATLFQELSDVMDIAEADEKISTIVLDHESEYFCIGMDFNEFQHNDGFVSKDSAYSDLLNRFTASPLAIVVILNGVVKAGGVGLVAAADIVISTEKTTFNLSEALWGLLPAQILPHIIRRTGIQVAYRMTLTCEVLTALSAHACHLIDFIEENPRIAVKQHIMKLSRISRETRQETKAYFKKMWIVDDAMCDYALETFLRLAEKPETKKRITDYVKDGKLPWS